MAEPLHSSSGESQISGPAGPQAGEDPSCKSSNRDSKSERLYNPVIDVVPIRPAGRLTRLLAALQPVALG